MKEFLLLVSLVVASAIFGGLTGIDACEGAIDSKLKACAKQHNVYECEIVAQPKKGQPE